MIKQASHDIASAAGDPSALTLALAVAAELHPPVKRAPEVAVTRAAARRTTTTARMYRRTGSRTTAARG